VVRSLAFFLFLIRNRLFFFRFASDTFMSVQRSVRLFHCTVFKDLSCRPDFGGQQTLCYYQRCHPVNTFFSGFSEFFQCFPLFRASNTIL
ncbi:MAG: hypothetical protein IKF50_08525, partial [Clostridia bacterium]|nr:hypothetical protein [Clostridia bacterium]